MSSPRIRGPLAAACLFLYPVEADAGSWDYPVAAAEKTELPPGLNHDTAVGLRDALIGAIKRRDRAFAEAYATQLQIIDPSNKLARAVLGMPPVVETQLPAPSQPVLLKSATEAPVAGRPTEPRFADFANAHSQAFVSIDKPSTKWDGVTSTGIPFQYYADGSGSIGPGLMGTWSIGCSADQMTDTRSCHASSTATGLMISFAGGKLFSLCAVGHDYPGRTAMFRVGDSAPVDANAAGACLIGQPAQALFQKLAPGVTVRTRHVEFPYDFPKDQVGTLDNSYPEMLRLVAFLYSAHLQ